MTWIAPNNITLAILTGSSLGLGLFNPLTTFDWNVATSSYAALSQPFFSTCTMYFGSILGGLVILAIYYSNMYNTAYLPINSSSAFANDGKSYQVQKVVVNNQFDETRYQNYSPPFYSAGYILTVGANFAFYPVYFLYIMLNQWSTMSKAYVDLYNGLRHGKGNYEGAMDVHSRLMAKYKEVPDWWFFLILAAAIVVSAIFLKIYPLDTPVWLVFLVIAINIVFAVPLSFLSATTGTNLGLGALIQIVTGFLLPNNASTFLFAQTLGSWALAGYGDNYVQDQKLAHYVKIAPRAVFRSQIGCIIITCFVAVATQNFILNNVEGLCTPDQPSRFTCANDGAPLYAASLMWGLLGSNRMFNSLYPLFKWCFLIGAGIALIFLAGQHLGPKHLPGVKERLRLRLRPRTFEILDRTLFPFVASLLWLNPVLIIQGVQHWAPSNMAYKTPGIILSFIFMYWLPRHRLAWWEKYNYVSSATPTFILFADPATTDPLCSLNMRRRRVRLGHLLRCWVQPNSTELVGQHGEFGWRGRERGSHIATACERLLRSGEGKLSILKSFHHHIIIANNINQHFCRSKAREPLDWFTLSIFMHSVQVTDFHWHDMCRSRWPSPKPRK